ncbi:MAG: hypothetical protein HYY16_16175 [Planctomycetes bacterium]|nr:hypothetical protein [Planctomycetota bacterium]
MRRFHFLIAFLWLSIAAAAHAQEESLVKKVWRSMWDGTFRLQNEWHHKRWAVGDVTQARARLVWFNPYAELPQFGIRPGDVLGDGQRVTLEEALSVYRAPDGAGTGKGAFPAHVGRALWPAPGALRVNPGDGVYREDLVVKGSGKNSPNVGRGDGTLETSEALLDAELSLRLHRAGVRIYIPLAVLELPDQPGRALYWRVPTYSNVRADELKGGLTPQEAQATLARIVADMSVVEGQPISLRQLAESALPAFMGDAAGRLHALGVFQGTLQWGGNTGVGETVDWGPGSRENGPELHQDRNAREFVEQKRLYLEDVLSTVALVNKLLPVGQTVPAEIVKDRFNEAYEAGRRGIEARGTRLHLDSNVLRRLDVRELRTLARGLGAPGMDGFDAREAARERMGPPGSNALSAEEALEFLRAKGVASERPEGIGWIGGKSPQSRSVSMIRDGVAGMGQFAAAYVVKESGKALAKRDLGPVKEALVHMKEPRFLASMAAFMAAARVADGGLARIPMPMLAKAGLSMAAGMAAAEAATGRWSGRDVIVGTGAYLTAGVMVGVVADALIKPTVAPFRWAMGICGVLRLAGALTVGERIEGRLRRAGLMNWIERIGG